MKKKYLHEVCVCVCVCLCVCVGGVMKNKSGHEKWWVMMKKKSGHET